MCVCVCVCAYVYRCVRVCACAYVYVRVRICMCIINAEIYIKKEIKNSEDIYGVWYYFN